MNWRVRTKKFRRITNTETPMDSSSQNSHGSSWGSPAERAAQTQFGTTQRALGFYKQQVCSELNDVMQEFILQQEFFFIATSDAQGNSDSSFRAGPPGFVHILDAKQLAFPEYRGNGVMASIGNMLENPHIGLLFIDFFQTTIGLHVNGTTQIIDDGRLSELSNKMMVLQKDFNAKGFHKPECWVVVHVEEAYIHCSKHIPLLEKKDKQVHWGTDDERYKGGNFFRTK